VKVLSPDLGRREFRAFQAPTGELYASIYGHLSRIDVQAGCTSASGGYTMPFVEGESLRVHLMRAGAMPIAVAVSILSDVARALEFAHAKGVVHRDIKPDNILLAGNTATVSDFGIAKALLASAHASHAVTVSAPRTDLGIVIGTPLYMAPEQAAADTGFDHRVDLYALGCVAYEMIAGEPPFTGSVAPLIRAHIALAPPPMVTKRADVPDAPVVLIERCLQKDPNDRPASASEILEVLRATRGGRMGRDLRLVGCGLLRARE
jgi:serine/threonine protein kinase